MDEDGWAQLGPGAAQCDESATAPELKRCLESANPGEGGQHGLGVLLPSVTVPFVGSEGFCCARRDWTITQPEQPNPRKKEGKEGRSEVLEV